MNTARRALKTANMWPLDLAFALLGVLVLSLAVRLLRFEDPRWQYNAWTYLIGVPSVLIAASMIARSFVSEQMERSIQIGFLFSVAIHFLLMLLAVNVVLFSGIWPDALKEAQRMVRSESRATQFVESRALQSLERPDYLKPVETAVALPSNVSVSQSAPTDALLERLKNKIEDPVKVERELADSLRAKASATKPDIQSSATKLDRPAREPSPQIANRKIDVPKVQVESWRDPTERSLDSLKSKASRMETSRSDNDPAPDSSSIGGRAWNALGDVQRSQSPDMNRNAATVPRVDRPDASLPSLDRFAESKTPSRPRSTSNGTLGGASRPIELPPTQEGEGGGNSRSNVSSSDGDSAANNPSPRNLLDRTAATGRMQSEADSQSSSERAAIADSLDGSESVTRASALLRTLDRDLGKPSVGAPQSTSSASVASAAAGASTRDLKVSDQGMPQLELGRFRRREAGGKIAKEAVPVPAPAFKQRMRRNDDAMSEDLKAMGPLGPQTEEAIERGLEFLAKYQRPDGSWHLEDFGDQPRLRSDTAATALSLLAFQGAGYSHEQFKYKDNCKAALEWLKSVQASNGDLFKPMDEASDRNAWLYSHAIATLALCEAYGMTQDVSLRQPAQRAIDFLVASQDPIGGGWRYAPRVGSDTSVTGWAMMALKSAELAGLQVPNKTYEAISRWLDGSQASARERFLFRYNWQANTPETIHGRVVTPVMTSVGLLMRLYLGWRRTNSDMVRGSDWLLARPPALGSAEAPSRDTYYWYYATQVMFHMGGERWRSWYTNLYPILIQSQSVEGEYIGSWDPAGDIPDAWGPYAGRLYVTTMNLLSLEVTYRHLPIYEATAK